MRLTDATDRYVMTVRAYTAELEREKIAGRTREHLESKVRKGFVTGGYATPTQ
jgi:DNA invertase Pin-like site-specific DNA recombinase